MKLLRKEEIIDFPKSISFFFKVSFWEIYDFFFFKKFKIDLLNNIEL